MKRRAPLSARFSERERPCRKVKRCQRDPSEELATARTPAQPAGDHQMNDEVEIVVERERDAFADTVDRADTSTLDLRKRRIHRAQYEGADDLCLLDRLIDESRPERFEVGEYFGGVGHT